MLYVTDVSEKTDPEGEYLKKIRDSGIPVIIVINKIDLTNQDRLGELVGIWHSAFPQSEIIPVSALKVFNLDNLLKSILDKLPEGEPYFPRDQLTDRYERFFASEIIREKIFANYQKEIPYSVEVEIDTFTEEPGKNSIRAIINVARESQKGIIIGHKGQMLKKVGTAARKEMEDFFGVKIFLELYVRVVKDWRNKTVSLKKFGYR